jgi:hypothetical protein
MNQHLERHKVGYVLVTMALANAFAEQFKGVTHQQVASMNWLDWMVSFAEFIAAAGTVLAAYLQKYPSYETSIPPSTPSASK